MSRYKDNLRLRRKRKSLHSFFAFFFSTWSYSLVFFFLNHHNHKVQLSPSFVFNLYCVPIYFSWSPMNTKRLKITISFYKKKKKRKQIVKRNKNLHEFIIFFLNITTDRKIFCIRVRKMLKFINIYICFNLGCCFLPRSSVSTYRHLDL